MQVNYLGYPGTMGAPFIDYIIGDKVVTPLSAQPLYDERIVQLRAPTSPMTAAAPSPPRCPAAPNASCRRAFVFCCFNNTYKITPAIFEIWMRLLEAVPDSVLWLFEANETARDNLHYEAGGYGIDPARIISPQARTGGPSGPPPPCGPVSGHLALQCPHHRQRCAVGRCSGDHVPRRGLRLPRRRSLLTAVGLPELVTGSLAEYEALALALARDPERLAALKAKLATQRATAPLFDAAAYTAGIEAAYERMHALRCAGKAPEQITI